MALQVMIFALTYILSNQEMMKLNATLEDHGKQYLTVFAHAFHHGALIMRPSARYEIRITNAVAVVRAALREPADELFCFQQRKISRVLALDIITVSYLR